MNFKTDFDELSFYKIQTKSRLTRGRPLDAEASSVCASRQRTESRTHGKFISRRRNLGEINSSSTSTNTPDYKSVLSLAMHALPFQLTRPPLYYSGCHISARNTPNLLVQIL